jgi:hypothetical protein
VKKINFALYLTIVALAGYSMVTNDPSRASVYIGILILLNQNKQI